MYPFNHPYHAQGSSPTRPAQTPQPPRTRSPYGGTFPNARGRSSPLEQREPYSQSRQSEWSTVPAVNYSSTYSSLPSPRASPRPHQYHTHHSNASASSFVDYYTGTPVSAMDTSPLIRGPTSTNYNNQSYDAQRQGYDQYDNYGPPPPNPYDNHNSSPASPAYNHNQLAPVHSNDGSYYNNDLTSYYSGDHDDRSYSSHTALNSSNSHMDGSPKSFGVGEVLPTMSYSTPPPPSPNMGYSYPPAPSQLPATPGFSGTSHWQKVRNNMMARRVVKKIPLTNGNFVIDVPVPKEVIRHGHLGIGAEIGEMEKMRYTAATCDPDDFMRCKFNLRPYLYGRRTELFIVMTMYNETADLLLRTLNSVIKNIANLCGRDRSKVWGAGAWQKVVVCIVADGRNVVDQRVLKVLQVMGIYAEGVMQDTVAGKDVTAHIFEGTSQVMVSETESGEIGPAPAPVQYIFCLKEKNAKKLNSHRWFFNAFGSLLKPNVCVLLDVGTKPSGNSIYELYKVFQKHDNVGGACGEIIADKGPWGRYLLNPIVAGQNFEYKMSNILDKPFESIFGFIAVLPGAFSAYRYAAVCNHPDGTGPLASYFHGEMMNLPGAQAKIFERNMFLAEDRILAFEIVTKKKAKWRLQYVKSAKASTDVPAKVPEFISQRRRWLNGSMFASIHALAHFWKVWTSGHNFIRKFALMFLTLYNLINLLFNIVSISSYYLAFYFLINSSVASPDTDPFFGAGEEIFQVVSKLYIAVLFVVLICSLGNRPQGSKWMYTICILFLAVCQGVMLYVAGWTVYQTVPHDAAGWRDVKGLFENETFRDLALALLATYGLYFISSLIYMEPWHMFTSFIQYLLLLPSYVNILLIYAFCNLHDVSWGTKGDNGSAKDLGQVKVTTKNGEKVAEVKSTRQEDIEDLYRQAKAELRIPMEHVKEKRSQGTKRADADRNFRTHVVLWFLGVNMVIILVLTSHTVTEWLNTKFNPNPEETNFNPYLKFIFWSVLGLSATRFTGCIIYLIFWYLGL